MIKRICAGMLLLALVGSGFAQPTSPATGTIWGSKIYSPVTGEIMSGQITGSVSGETQFALSEFSSKNYPNDYFNKQWSVYVISAANVSAGLLVDITDFVSSVGTFTTASAGANWAIGDHVQLIFIGPSALDELDAVGSICYPGRVTTGNDNDTLYCEAWIGLGNDRFNDGYFCEVTYHPTTAPRRQVRDVLDFISSSGGVVVSPAFSDTVDVNDILTIWHSSAIEARLPGRLSYEGTASVTDLVSPADSFYVTDLIGFGDDHFNYGRYWAHVIHTTDGAAPLGEYLPITDYISNTGLFTVSSTVSTQAGFSAVVTAQDKIAIVHESAVKAAKGNPATGMQCRVDNNSGNTTTNFYVTELKSYPDSVFTNSWIEVIYDAGGAHAAPEGERRKVSKLNTATGLVTVASAYGAAPAGGDLIRIYNGNVEDVLWGPGGVPSVTASRMTAGVSIAEGQLYTHGIVDTVYHYMLSTTGAQWGTAAEPAAGVNLFEGLGYAQNQLDSLVGATYGDVGLQWGSPANYANGVSMSEVMASVQDLIDTLTVEVGVLQDTLNARVGYFGIPGVQVDTCTTPDGSVSAWVAGASHRMFTVTNTVYIHGVYGIVGQTITELAAACTIELGVAGATDGLIATTDPPTTLAAGDVWTNSGTASLVPLGTPSDAVIVHSTDIDMTVGGVGATDDVNDGYITIVVIWSPAPPVLGTGAGTLVRATWD